MQGQERRDEEPAMSSKKRGGKAKGSYSQKKYVSHREGALARVPAITVPAGNTWLRFSKFALGKSGLESGAVK